MAIYYIIHNRSEYPIAQTDDIENAGRIVNALMRSRETGRDWDDFWVRIDDPENGAELYWSREYRTIFSPECFIDGCGDK